MLSMQNNQKFLKKQTVNKSTHFKARTSNRNSLCDSLPLFSCFFFLDCSFCLPKVNVPE